MALDCAPSTVQAKRTGAAIPVELARLGMSGKSAGVTTPVVELKKLMMAPMMENAIGIKGFGTLLPTQLLSMVMVPALTATAISMPAPAIMTMVFQGILAIASFCGAKSRSRAMTAKMMATRPTSIFVSIENHAIVAWFRKAYSYKKPPNEVQCSRPVSQAK